MPDTARHGRSYAGSMAVEQADGLTVAGVTVGNRIYGSHTFGAVADMVDAYVFTCPVAMKFVGFSEVHITPESIGTVGIMPRRCQAVEAPASGDALLSTALDGLGTAATVQNGTLVTTAVVNFAAGNRLAIDFTGDVPGELAGVTVSWSFELT